jgi:hypothetical protein
MRDLMIYGDLVLFTSIGAIMVFITMALMSYLISFLRRRNR